jgi:hypothetical protein
MKVPVTTTLNNKALYIWLIDGIADGIHCNDLAVYMPCKLMSAPVGQLYCLMWSQSCGLHLILLHLTCICQQLYSAVRTVRAAAVSVTACNG